jgi:hypothetical protein
MVEERVSAGIVRLKADDLNIPERDCCGEAVQCAPISLIAEENFAPCHAERSRNTPAIGMVLAPLGGELAP